MTPSKPGDRIKVSVFVAVPPAAAFAAFTEQIDQWWRRGPAYRIAGRSPGAMHLEPRLGGRIFETYSDGDERHEVGAITAWQPPDHFAFTWRSITFTRGETTQVEVTFRPRRGGTDVALEHSGWTAIPDDHPVRHGQVGSAFLGGIGRWWADLLTSLADLVAGGAGGAGDAGDA
jgi:uncharacterized protein YndB with AHSA1/START domain